MNAECRSFAVAAPGYRPATFRHPLYSVAGDFVMFKDIVLGRLPW